RPVEAGNETCPDGIGTAGEDDRYRRRQRLGDQSRVVSPDRRDDGDLASDQVGGQWPQLVHSIVREAVIDRDVAALGVAGLVEAFPKPLGRRGAVNGRGAGEEPTARHRPLRRARRERPRDRRTADQRYELAPLHSITSSAATSNLSGTVRPSIRAVDALMTSSNFDDCTTGRSAGFVPLRTCPT